MRQQYFNIITWKTQKQQQITKFKTKSPKFTSQGWSPSGNY
jgi:hypothetical protein